MNKAGQVIQIYAEGLEIKFFIMAQDDQVLVPFPQENMIMVINLRDREEKKIHFDFLYKFDYQIQAHIFNESKMLCFS